MNAHTNSFLSSEERAFGASVACLAYCNPFLGERIDCERAALGGRFKDLGEVWHVQPDQDGNVNVERINRDADALAESLRRRLKDGLIPTEEEARIYRDLVIYLLYYRYEKRFFRMIEQSGKGARKPSFYRAFRQDFNYFFDLAGAGPMEIGAPHLFACFFQVRRAFHLIFGRILGGSRPVARLRAAVWESVFTHDMRRYRRSLYLRLGDVTTLITGPSGTGKELVAQAIGLARYLPFDETSGTFSEDYESSFFPLNLSALSPTLIESELFGHRRGAFTGALDDRAGWLEVCPRFGSVFLDEVGDVDPAIQVKLLRVLQTRQFQRLGETGSRPFRGKILAATNRDPAVEMRTGRLREDFYYRLCSDLITTPSLQEQLEDAPEHLAGLVHHLAQRIAGEDEAEIVAEDVLTWIDRHLEPGYPWPGNVRELEQCVRNVMIRGSYRPRSATALHPKAGPDQRLQAALASGALTADELLIHYVTRVYALTGSYQEAGRRLELDRRTVKAKVDRGLLEELSSIDQS